MSVKKCDTEYCLGFAVDGPLGLGYTNSTPDIIYYNMQGEGNGLKCIPARHCEIVMH